MKKRLLSLILVLILILDMFPAAVFAVEGERDEVVSQIVNEIDSEESRADEENNKIDSEESGTDEEDNKIDSEESGTDEEDNRIDSEESGTDEEDNRIDSEESGINEEDNRIGDGVTQVSNQNTLAGMTQGNYQLTNDIVLDASWESLNFSGTLDGNGYTITLNGKPLFDRLTGTVTNLLLDGQVNGSFNDANFGALANISSGEVRNIYTNTEINYSGWGNTGGFIGKIEGGSITSCLATGTNKVGMAESGGISGGESWVTHSAIIDNCYWTSEHSNAMPGVTAINSIKIDPEQLGSADLATKLNRNLKEGDLIWGLTDGGVLVPGGEGEPEASVVDKEELNTEIAKAEALSESDYTPETWAVFKVALMEAREVAENEHAFQSEVNKALANLTNAMEALKEDLSNTVDRSELQQAISEAKAVNGVYTADTWEKFKTALAESEVINADSSADQDAIDEATNQLNTTKAELVVRNLLPVDSTGKDVIFIETEKQLKEAFEKQNAGKYLQLKNDIEIKGPYWYNMQLNGTLDGNGHVITLSDISFISNIGPDGVVQNLGVKGSALNSVAGEGAIATKSSGLIVNSWSQASVKSESGSGKAGGLVSKLESGGAIVNSYAAGEVSAKGATGGLAGEADANSMLKNSYWSETMDSKAIGIGDGQLEGTMVKTQKDLHSKDFISLLNKNRDGAMEWNLSSEGYPYHGEPQEFVPEESVEVTFKSHVGDIRKFQSEDGLRISLLEIGAFNKVGTLSYPNAAHWTIHHPDSGGKKPIMVADETGELFVYGQGSAEVVVSDASWNTLVKFTVIAELDEVKGLRFSVGDNIIENGKLTVLGSEEVTLTPQVEVGEGRWENLPPGLFTYTDTGNIRRTNSTFYAKEPGEMTVTAKGFGQTATVSITSEYVPVISIQPAPSGKYIIHGRNANSSSLGDFLDLNLSAKAGSVVVEPENASYRDNWTMTSSDPSIAEYVSSFLLAVLPKKTGTVTLTATTKDPRMTQQISGTSEIELEYRNPVTAITVEKDTLTLKENEEIRLPLIFTGTQSATDAGYKYVTEPGMEWSFSGEGRIEIVRNTLGILVGSSDSEEYAVANDQYELVGITAGEVKVTGTPMDQTGGAKPVTFTVIVESGDAKPPANHNDLVVKGIKGAQNYLYKGSEIFQYGKEWDIFALARSGEGIKPHVSESYLKSVQKKYSSNPNATDLKPTTLARVVLALGVLGKDASNFEGLNFIEMLTTSNRIAEGGNEPAWALIALNSRKYSEPGNAVWTRNKLISELITKYQNEQNGGFGLTDNKTVSVDITAMAIQALAPYYNTRQDVRESVDKALDYLRSRMTYDSGFDGNVEAATQVLVALTELGKDPLDEKNGFTKFGGRNLITNIISFMDEETGGFKHTVNSKIPQRMSSIQALYSLDSYQRFQENRNSIYDLTDVGEIDFNSRIILEARLAEANMLVELDYTEQSWAVLETAKEIAQNVLNRLNATEEELKNADKELEAAIMGLEFFNPELIPDGEMMTVSFRLVGDTKHDTADEHESYINWIRTFNVEIPKGSTVYDAFEIALGQNGMSFVEGQHSYISAIQAPPELGGYWLSEFDNGPNSGWKYLVNGEYPDMGLRYYELNDGDSIIWRYVDDYSLEDDNSDKWQEAEDMEPDASLIPKPDTEEIKVNPNEPFVLDEKLQGDISTPITLDFGESITELPKVTAQRGNTLLEIAQGTIVTSDWDGKLQLPTRLSTSDFDLQQINEILGLSDKKVSKINFRLKVGGAKTITFNQHVTLILEDQGDLEAGYIDEKGNFKWIKKTTSANQKENEYAYKSGRDLIIKTNHFTEFITFSATAIEKPIEKPIDKPTEKPIEELVDFSDIEDSWAKEFIEKAARLGIIKGYPDGTFKPKNTITRAQAVSIIVRGLELTTDKSAPFKDINGYAKDIQQEIAAAYQHGIVVGHQGNFNPSSEVTRSHLALMIHRAYTQRTGNEYVAKQIAPYPDLGGYDKETVNAISMLYELEIATGSYGKYMPATSTTRAEAAKMFVNFFERLER